MMWEMEDSAETQAIPSIWPHGLEHGVQSSRRHLPSAACPPNALISSRRGTEELGRVFSDGLWTRRQCPSKLQAVVSLCTGILSSMSELTLWFLLASSRRMQKSCSLKPSVSPGPCAEGGALHHQK